MTLVFTAAQAARLRFRSLFADSQLNPVPLADGRYALSERVLTDPRFALYRVLLREGTIVAQESLTFQPGEPFRITPPGGKVCYLSAAEKAHAFDIPSANVYRFETRRGESGYSGDAGNGNRRSELVGGGSGDRYASGTTLWVSFSFVVGPQHEPFDTGGSLQLLHQWHSVDTTTPRSPILGVSLDSGNLRVYTRSDATGATAQNHYQQARPADGVPHHVVIAGKLGQAGHLDVWLDGVPVVGKAVPVGYFNDDGGARDLAYPHFGIYQNDTAAPCVSFIANPEWGTADLSARVATPLPVGAPPGGWE